MKRKREMSRLEKLLELRSLASQDYPVEEIAQRLDMSVDDVIVKVREYGYRIRHSMIVLSSNFEGHDAAMPPYPEKKKRKRALYKNGITNSEKSEMIMLRAEGYTYEKIASMTGRAYSTVRRVCVENV